jgi:hypothetical protein
VSPKFSTICKEKSLIFNILGTEIMKQKSRYGDDSSGRNTLKYAQWFPSFTIGMTSNRNQMPRNWNLITFLFYLVSTPTVYLIDVKNLRCVRAMIERWTLSIERINACIRTSAGDQGDDQETFHFFKYCLVLGFAPKRLTVFWMSNFKEGTNKKMISSHDTTMKTSS